VRQRVFSSVLTVLIKVPNATFSSHAITQDGARYFGLMSLRSPYGDYTDTVGLRNSHDKSFPIGLAFGSRVWAQTAFLLAIAFYLLRPSLPNGVRERITFLSLYLFRSHGGWGASMFCCLWRTSENRSMSAMRGNPENICSHRVFLCLAQSCRCASSSGLPSNFPICYH
jgi:hypothetical protein